MKQAAFFVVAFAAVLSASGWLLGMYFAGGAFVYPLDDAYIHLAIARNIAENGTWGIEKGVPVFASSSPLWTLLLALAIKVVGCREWLPLAFSYLFALGIPLMVFRFWKDAGLPPRRALAAGVVLVLVMPITTLANLGMEHALHVFCIIWFICSAWTALMHEDVSGGTYAALIISAMLAAGARYESLFVITPIAALLLWRRRVAAGCVLLVAQFIPVALMGVYAVFHSRPFLPVSLLLKANVGADSIIGGFFSLYCGISPDSIHFHLTVLLLLSAVLLTRTPAAVRALCLAIAIALCGHGVLAQLGWLYRYEVYLLAIAFTVLPLAVDWSGRPEPDFFRRYAWLLLVLGIAWPFAARSFKAQFNTVLAHREINAQQMQMGRIFGSLQPQERGAVAVTDLGCVAFYSGVHVLDLWGLGSPEVAEIILDGKDPPCGYADLFRRNGVRYFAFYDGWCDMSKVSEDARVVATLTLRHKPVICAGRTVVLGVVHSADAPAFAAHIRKMASSMPEECGLKVREGFE